MENREVQNNPSEISYALWGVLCRKERIWVTALNGIRNTACRECIPFPRRFLLFYQVFAACFFILWAKGRTHENALEGVLRSSNSLNCLGVKNLLKVFKN